MLAQKPPIADKEEQKNEYKAIFAVFERFIKSIKNNSSQWEVLEELILLRVEFAIQHAIKGFDMDYEKALELVRDYDGDLSDYEQERRKILIAAINNLVDFSVGAEYQMAMELLFEDESDDDDGSEDWEDEDWDEYIGMFENVCYKYNYRYANVENMDIEYAMGIAAFLAKISSKTILTFMTQGDERVRPWHLQYEGYSAPKDKFPVWLIPPIEHACRCYLLEDSIVGGMLKVQASSELKMPDWFNPVFKESVAFGGRIFSDEHSYFKCEERHSGILNDISQRIKNKYLNAG